jgi:hypothetical protein
MGFLQYLRTLTARTNQADKLIGAKRPYKLDEFGIYLVESY